VTRALGGLSDLVASPACALLLLLLPRRPIRRWAGQAHAPCHGGALQDRPVALDQCNVAGAGRALDHAPAMASENNWMKIG
jgi:hypothetical protein